MIIVIVDCDIHVASNNNFLFVSFLAHNAVLQKTHEFRDEVFDHAPTFPYSNSTPYITYVLAA